MFTALGILLIIVSILLILVVLIQPGKGDMLTGMGGLTGQFNTIFGTRRASNLLTRFTAGLAVVIVLLTILTNFLVTEPQEVIERPVTEGANVPAPVQQPTLPPPPVE